MPIGYGSNIVPPMLLSEEIAKPEIEQKESNSIWLNIFDWFTIIAEVAIGFIPGVGAVADTAIAAAAAGLRTGVKAAAGQELSALDVGLDFGTAAIPGLLGGLKGFSKGISNVKAIEKISTKAEKLKSLSERAYNSFLNKPTTKYSELQKEFILRQKDNAFYFQQIKEGSNFFRSPSVVADRVSEASKKLLDLLPKGTSLNEPLTGLLYNTIELGSITQKSISTTRGILEGGFGTGRKSANIQNEAEAIGKALAREFNISFSQFRRLSRLLRNAPRAERAELLISELLALGKSIETIENIMLKSQNVLRTFAKFSNNYNATIALRHATHTTIKRLFKGLQYITNPTTVVSKIVEKTIGKTASKIEESVKLTLKKISGIVKKGAKGAREMEEHWLRTGGLRMKNTTSAVYGVKIINETPALFTVLVKFNPWDTGGATGKNVGGKKDVIISMTPLILKQFIQHVHPMRMYLDTWARSRGGRKAGGLLNEDVIGYVEELVGFLHIDQIGEYVGMVSYMKNIFKPGNQVHFIWTKNFYADLKKQLILTIPQESIKLVAAFFPGRIGKTLSEKIIKGAIFNNDSIFKSIRSQVSSEGQRMRGETGAGKSFEKLQAVKGIGGSIKGLK